MDQIIQLTINKRPMDHIAHLRMFHVKSYQYVGADKEKKIISFLGKEWFFICKKMKINWIPITQRRFLPCVVKKSMKWFWRNFLMPSKYFQQVAMLFLMETGLVLHIEKKSFYPMICWVKFGWNKPSGLLLENVANFNFFTLCVKCSWNWPIGSGHENLKINMTYSLSKGR